MLSMVLPGCLGSSGAQDTRSRSSDEAVEIVAEVEIDAAAATRGAKVSLHLERADGRAGAIPEVDGRLGRRQVWGRARRRGLGTRRRCAHRFRGSNGHHRTLVCGRTLAPGRAEQTRAASPERRGCSPSVDSPKRTGGNRPCALTSLRRKRASPREPPREKRERWAAARSARASPPPRRLATPAPRTRHFPPEPRGRSPRGGEGPRPGWLSRCSPFEMHGTREECRIQM
jgi:hypothetical protein